MNCRVSFVLFALAILVASDIVTLDREVLRQIYQQNKIVITYVHGDLHNFQVQSIFNSHCFGEKLCALLEPNNPNYYEFLQFIGNSEDQFFIILDPETKRKYILPIPTTPFTANDLLSFEYQFQYKELQPFFASEAPPQQKNHRCAKLVGRNVGEFLRRPERVKVIFLFNLNEHCTSCEDTLRQFIPYAEEHFEENTLAFGYFNTFLNDHPVIQDEKTPSFLIFLDQHIQSPFQLEGGELSGLSYFLAKTLGRPLPEAQDEESDTAGL